MLSLRQLRYFVAVARSGSFTAAAEELHISQPAVGLQVKFLEERLGIALFERHSRGAEITEAGRIFLGHSEKVLRTLDEAEHAVAQLRKRQNVSIRLGITPTLGRTILPQMLYKMSQPDSNIRITFQEDVSDKLIERLRANELDATFSYDPKPNPSFGITPLFSEDLCLVGPASVIGDGQDPIEFKALTDLPIVLSPKPNLLRLRIDNAAASHGLEYTNLVELDLIGLKREFLLRYDYCAISPYGLFLEDIRKGLLSARPIVSPKLSRTMCLVFDRKTPASSFNRLFEMINPLIAAEIESGELHWTAPTQQAVER